MLRVWKFMLPAFCVLALLACAEEGAEDATDEMADTTAMADGVSVADLAGTWDMVTTNTDPADTFVNRYQVVIDETSWALIFPDRDPVPATFVIDGDSIMVETASFESVRRPGTMVFTNTVFRLEGDRLVGDVIGHYQTTGPDSVVYLRTEGTRTP